MCRQLDSGESIHKFDAGLDCNSTTYHIFSLIALVCMCLYPFGIPIGFGVLLYSNRAVLSKDYSKDIDFKKFAGLAKLYTPEGSELPDTEVLVQKFNKIDDDASGIISSNELAKFSICTILHDTLSQENVKLEMQKIAGIEKLRPVLEPHCTRATKLSWGNVQAALEKLEDEELKQLISKAVPILSIMDSIFAQPENLQQFDAESFLKDLLPEVEDKDLPWWKCDDDPHLGDKAKLKVGH